MQLSAYAVILCVVKIVMLTLPIKKQSSETIIKNLEFEEYTGFLEEPSKYCHMNLSIDETIKAKEKFEEEMVKNENVLFIFISQKPVH